MRITVNDEVMNFDAPVTVSELLASLGRPAAGMAVAVNQTIVVRGCWSEHVVRDGDQILLFQAIAGG
ncbi:sulfur carrier protein ThiS [Morganella morganii]|uniref:Sulfur carrier protein ThiS n=1 Tax=Morganella morganii TaxID=582 RepID=A0A9Q4CSC1_MORMO|nr:sulfur carrier protein ThiS [Morganella morganii]BEP22929.1 sulfur carrier protein ThiS [Morganella morganii subsp. sibonii]EGT3623054.1 sulfur carrier protein ThiS [Morganella morganii]EGT3631837.1 sulfur carrier protein ThiS [Morganella morganii]EGT3635678.1 sulfur carrier protein ThiS [Morganella morganii]EJD6040711.1 sulfur carrier protein ThiS [Morganella morganii]